MNARVEESDLVDRKQIASGGMAKIYALPSYVLPEKPDEPQVYKKYKAKLRPVPLAGLDQLVRARQALPPAQREAFDRSLNWPRRVAVDGGTGAAGVILPLISDGFFHDLDLPSGARERTPAEGQFLQMGLEYCASVHISFATSEQRLMLARSLVYAMGLLHRVDVVYGDLSSRNFLYELTPRPRVLLVDCDAVRVKGGSAALGAQPHTPDWQPPEALLAERRRDGAGFAVQNKATDRYKLGLAILRILTPGAPTVARDPRAARRCMPSRLYRLLERSLSDDPAARPDAKTWFTEWGRG